MDTNQINNSLREFPQYVGCFARDELPLITSWPCALVVNTDPSSQPGTHWVGIYINELKYGTYFDSFGLKPMHKDIISFLEQNSPAGISYNKIILQSTLPFSSACGPYCVLFISLKCLNVPFSHFLSLFSSDRLSNEVIVRLLTKI